MRIPLVGMGLLLIVGVARAGDFQDEPYALRLSLTLDRQSNYAATVGRQASVAATQASSANPAADDWLYRADHPVVTTFTAINAFAESGAWIAALVGSINIQTPNSGTWSFAYARTETFDQSVQHDFENEIRSNEFFIGYGKKLSDSIAVGTQLHIIEGDLQEENLQSVDGVPFQVPMRTETELFSFDISVGLTFKLSEQWAAGITGGWGYGMGDVQFENIASSAGPNPSPIPPGVVRGRFDDDIRSWSFRGGMGYLPTESVGVYLDIQYLHVESNVAGSVDLGRVAIGVEYEPTETFVLRAGVLVDSVGETTVSAGFGFYGWGFPLEVGYQYNAAPEVKAEFGRVHLLSVSIVIPF